MARPSTPLSAQLSRLDAAKKRADALGTRATVSFKPMAEILGISRQSLSNWTDTLEGFEQSGCYKRGGNGIEWEFKAVRTVNWLLKHFTKKAEKQAAKSRAISRSVGVTLPDAEAAPSLAETKDLVNLTLTVVAASEKQRQYAVADEVHAFMAGYNQAVVDGIMGVRTRVDPNGNLPPSVRKQVDEYLRSVATAVHARAALFIEDYRARSGQAGVGRAS